MNWSDHRDSWPHSAQSRFVETAGHNWHLQEFGAGREVILLHGAGGSCHSWRDCAPILAKHYRVIALDLPGQGFTRATGRGRFSLDMMSADTAQLLSELEITPKAIIGHSAGMAIALRMALDWPGAKDARIIGLNGALGNFDGLAGVIFPAMAKLLALNPLTAPLFSRTASSMANVRRLIHSTGSPLTDEGVAYYQRLVSDAGHVSGALSMMANWSLNGLLAALPDVQQKTLLLAGSNDKTVPPDVSKQAAAKIPNAEFKSVDGLGHLMHEEAPELLCSEMNVALDNTHRIY